MASSGFTKSSSRVAPTLADETRGRDVKPHVRSELRDGTVRPRHWSSSDASISAFGEHR
jgi:hypothetical protein